MSTDKVNVKNLTKAELADYAMSHFSKIINRKNSKPQVIKEFRKVEKEFLEEKKLQESEKEKANDKRQDDHKVISEKQRKEDEETINYPVEMKDDEGETTMHRPCVGAICLGDPIIRKVVEGETVTDSAPHLNKEQE